MYHTLLLFMSDYITSCQVISVHYVYLPGIKHQQMTATLGVVHQRSVSLEYADFLKFCFIGLPAD